MHEKTPRLLAALLTVGLLALVAGARAQSDPTEPTPSTSTTATTWTASALTATVVSVDPQAKTVSVRTDAGSTQSFLVSDTTWMRASGKDIAVSELKVGDRVRIEPTPGSASDTATRTASRLEVIGAGSVQGSTGTTYGSESPTMGTGTQPGTGSTMGSTSSDRTARPILGESPDAGGDRQAMPATPGSTTGRSVSTDRPVFGQKSEKADTSTSTSTTSTTTATAVPTAPAPPPANTFGSTSTATSSTTTYRTTTPPSSSVTTTTPSTTPSSTATRADADIDDQDEDELPATASPLPLVGLMGLLALAAGLAVRATRKQLS
jgi:hypothetical protein